MRRRRFTCSSSHGIEVLEPRRLLSAPGSEWRLVWGDEFNGNALEASKWSTNMPWTGPDGTNRYFGPQQLSYDQENDVLVSGGMLHLLTQKQDVTDPAGQTFHYTAGMITSSGKFDMRYGYVEVRAQVPTSAGPGLWPIFWMLQPGWPPEDDVAEFFTSSNRFHQGLAYGSSPADVHWDDLNTNTPLPTGFHTYGMQWGPGYQIFTVDGRITHTVRAGYVPTGPMYLLLNSAVAAQDPPTAATVFPNSFDVDYVHVYQRTAAPQIDEGSFEEGRPGLWSATHDAGIVAYNAHSGTYALQSHTVGSGASQVLTGLKPNTSYVLTGYAETSDASVQAQIGASGYGGQTVHSSVSSTSYAATSVSFTTGPTNTTATVYAQQAAGSGWAWYDDLDVHQAMTIDNVGFEYGSPGAWTVGPSAAILADHPHRGHFALREDGPSAVAQQTIYGLQPNTTYRLSGWTRSASPADAAVLSVTDSSGATASASSASTRYAPLAVDFTTGPDSTTATIFCLKPLGAGGAWFDDLQLAAPAPVRIARVPNRTVVAGRMSAAIGLVLSRFDSSGPASLTAAASDAALLPAGSFTFAGSGTRRRLFIRPPLGAQGLAVVTVTAHAADGRSAAASFNVRIVAPRLRS